MPRDPRAWLADIVAACDLLIEFTGGKTFSDYSADPLLRSAVERQFEIVGEALRVALQHQPELGANITDARAIIAFRNQLTHAYSAVDHATVWGLLERRVPQLRAEVARLLDTLARRIQQLVGFSRDRAVPLGRKAGPREELHAPDAGLQARAIAAVRSSHHRHCPR